MRSSAVPQAIQNSRSCEFALEVSVGYALGKLAGSILSGFMLVVRIISAEDIPIAPEKEATE